MTYKITTSVKNWPFLHSSLYIKKLLFRTSNRRRRCISWSISRGWTVDTFGRKFESWEKSSKTNLVDVATPRKSFLGGVYLEP